MGNGAAEARQGAHTGAGVPQLGLSRPGNGASRPDCPQFAQSQGCMAENYDRAPQERGGKGSSGEFICAERVGSANNGE